MTPDTPCSCTVGAKRCTGSAIQVCEATTPGCPSWGPSTECPGGSCSGSSCQSNCQDTCPGGTTRCVTDANIEVCRIGPSGCLQWTQQACPAAQYCGGDSCKPVIPCEPACPGGYSCAPTGVCTGGSPTSLTLDVKTVAVSGKVTLNGATPMRGSSCTGNPGVETASLYFTEPTKGYSFSLVTLCSDSTFSFSGRIYPGTYQVRIQNVNGSSWSNIPQAGSTASSYVADPALVLNADTSGLVLDVKTVAVSGKVTLNGATPMKGSSCTGNPGVETASLYFTEPTTGYSFSLVTLCSDNTFSFSGKAYPGTYRVRVQNVNGSSWSNIPQAGSTASSYVANAALMLNADTGGLVLDVKTVAVSGKVTLNGATPMRGSSCTGNPGVETASLYFSDSTQGYTSTLVTLCSDNMFGFSGQLYPGTYSVRIQNVNGSSWSNLPQAGSTASSYKAVSQIRIP